jgi:hypothetical protein
MGRKEPINHVSVQFAPAHVDKATWIDREETKQNKLAPAKGCFKKSEINLETNFVIKRVERTNMSDALRISHSHKDQGFNNNILVRTVSKEKPSNTNTLKTL